MRSKNFIKGCKAMHASLSSMLNTLLTTGPFLTHKPVAQLDEHRAVTRAVTRAVRRKVVSSTPAGPSLRVLK